MGSESIYIHCKNKGVMVAHLVTHSHRFKEFYGDHCANMTPLGAAVTPLFYSIACKPVLLNQPALQPLM